MPTANGSELDFEPAAWSGGYVRNNSGWCGRPWVAVYGAESPDPRASLQVILSAAPSQGTLVLTGMDDELPGNNHIQVAVNGQIIFDGPSPFPSWDNVGQCSNPAWTDAALPIPPGVLQAGSNEITVSNLTDGDAVGQPPYVMISDTRLRLASD